MSLPPNLLHTAWASDRCDRSRKAQHKRRTALRSIGASYVRQVKGGFEHRAPSLLNDSRAISTTQAKSPLRPTLQKIPPIRPRMRNHALIRTPPRKNNTIRTRAPARVNSIAVQNRILIPRPRVREIKVLVVVVLVWVTAGGVAGTEVRAAFGKGFVDVRLVVAGVAAGFFALSGEEEGG